MNKILIYFLKCEMRKAINKMNKEENDIVKKAFRIQIESYSSAILFLSVS